MLNNILMLENNTDRFKQAAKAWSRFGGCLKKVSSADYAVNKLQIEKLDLIVINADFLNEQLLSTIGNIRIISEVPILVFTSRYCAHEKISSIYAGADEYLPFPETLEECMISGVALIRRSKISNRRNKTVMYTCGDLELDIERRVLNIAGDPLELTRGEFYCLELFMSQPGKVFDMDTIYHCAFRDAAVADDIVNSVRALIKRTRNKIHSDQTKYIKTARGMGYFIMAGEENKYTPTT